VLRDVYRALVASRLGTEQEVTAHLASAASGTRNDPSLAGVVAGYAEAFDQPAIAAEALQNLMADPGRIARTGPKVLRLLNRVDDTQPLLQALERLVQVNPGDAKLRNERAWWLLITGQRIEESRAVAEELLKDSPSDLRYLATLSLAHLRVGNADRAIQVIELPFLGSTNPPSRARMAYAAALGNAGQREAARRVARPLSSQKLRTAERILITNWFDSVPNP
jgi:Flp pilus assembly protein TadD